MPDEVVLEPEIESLVAFHAAPEGPATLLDSEPSMEAAVSALEPSAEEPIEELATDWREELAAKMQNYRTRRKPRAPKYPSLQIPLQLPVLTLDSVEPCRLASVEVSRSANALEPLMESEPGGLRLGPELVEPISATAETSVPDLILPTNLIAFPRSMESEAWDGLAEPVIEQPRILDAPELIPAEPALGGILLEAPVDANSRPVADSPIRPASITRRCLAAILDAAIVGCGIVVWGWIASKITHEIPPRSQLLMSAVVAAVGFWLIYQYLFVVYTGTTLGMRACGLEMVCMDSKLPGRKQRRWRLLASLLSAVSMMLGFVWVLLDENRLCWHDRITHTYLRVQQRRSV